MQAVLVETNGASLTLDVKDVNVTGHEAKKHVEEIIQNMGFKDATVILSYCSMFVRITARVVGSPEEIEDLENAVKSTNRYNISSNKGIVIKR